MTDAERTAHVEAGGAIVPGGVRLVGFPEAHPGCDGAVGTVTGRRDGHTVSSMSRPLATKTTDGSLNGAEGLLRAPEIHLPLTSPNPLQSVSATRAAVFKAAALFRPSLSHRRVSRKTIPYPEQVQDGREGVSWSDKSHVEIQQIE